MYDLMDENKEKPRDINKELLDEQLHWVNHKLKDYIINQNPTLVYDGSSKRRQKKKQLLSHPFYMGLSDEYLKCNTGKRIMVVGREAMSYGKINDGTAVYDFIKSCQPPIGKENINEPTKSQGWTIAYFNKQLNKRYAELPKCFDKIKGNSSSFWNLFRLLKECGFEPCWNNVDKVYFETTLSYEAENILSAPYIKDGKEQSLLQREIKIAKPNIVLFATGADYGKSIFKALQIDGDKIKAPKPEKNENCLSKLTEVDGVPYYWCDHPRGLMAKGFKKQDVLEYIINKLK